MKEIKSLAQAACALLIAGALIGAGMRFTEHYIDAPEIRMIVCMAGDIDTHTVCKPIKEWEEQAKKKGLM